MSMTLRCLFFSLILLSAAMAFGQKATISGYVEDEETGEKLIAASVFEQKSLAGLQTNNYGFYSITLPAGVVRLAATYVGYEPFELQVDLQKDTVIMIRLRPAITLQTVEVVSTGSARPEEETQMSVVQVPIETIKKIPSLMGEVDVLKVLQLLPGVQSGGEGQNGLYVRGGSPDQNLILLDGVPVYNVSHLLGFFSVFNADAINQVTLTKGGFPARYGGRLSSVIDISMKEGNNKEFRGSASLGLIASRLTLEGPIVKEKASFIVSGRRTYLDVLVRPLLAAASSEDEYSIRPTLYFYDLNAKVNWRINDRHRVYLSTYTGEDKFALRSTQRIQNSDDYFRFDAGTDWGNLTTALRWNYMISPRFFANTTLTYSQYKFNFLAGSEDRQAGTTNAFSARYLSGIYDYAFKADFDYVPDPGHFVRFGGALTHHTYDPGAFQYRVRFDDFNRDTTLGAMKSRSLEYYFYAEDDMRIGALSINAGLHYSGFRVLDDQGAFYHSLQPRLGLRYQLDNRWALKASYARMAQYINLLTNEGLSLPTDLWVPSTARIAPQFSDQWAAGTTRTLWDSYEFSVEAFYKRMDNVLSYKEGADFLGLEQDWQDKVLQGMGESYGVELFLQKKIGKLTGWLGYTLAWNWRQFDDINGGRRYPFKYDRRHDASIVAVYDLTEKIRLSATWVFGTGNAITLPVTQYVIPVTSEHWFYEIESPTEKNSFRMNNYHRLDVSMEFTRKRTRYERSWVIGIYNAYNRRNPYFIYRGRDLKGDPVYRQVSLFPIIPSIAYNFKF